MIPDAALPVVAVLAFIAGLVLGAVIGVWAGDDHPPRASRRTRVR